MDWGIVKQRFVRLGLAPPAEFILPPVLLEIQPGFVAAARVGVAKQRREVLGFSVVAIPPSAVLPHASRSNLADAAAVRSAVADALAAVNGANERIGLLVPDASARVNTLALAALPEDRHDARSLIRWKLAENLPFTADAARVNHQVLINQRDHVEVLAMAAKESVVAEYESTLGPARAAAALVLPATIALLPMVPEGPEQGQLLVHVCRGFVTAVVMADRRVCLWRTREVGPDPADALRDVLTEVARVRAASRDHLKMEVSHAWLVERPAALPELERDVSRLMNCPVRTLTTDPELGSSLPEEAKHNFARYGALTDGLVRAASAPPESPRRIAVNLASSPTLRDRYSLATAGSTAGLALLALLLLARSLWVNYRSYQTARAEAARDERQQVALHQKEQDLRRYLEQPKYSGTYREVKFVNALIGEKKLSASGLVSRVNDLLPPEVKLTRLVYAETAEGATVHFEVAGRNQAALDDFIGRLEQAKDFADPRVATVGLDKQNQAKTGSTVSLSCRASYRGIDADPSGAENAK
ncbi:MAG TPA: hypothetical protein VGZ29_03285 [Terriglobia bacterium]|nr:hypothetical protein [Terriglobia bacterium]